MIKKMDTKYTDIGCLDIPKLWYTYRKRCGNEGNDCGSNKAARNLNLSWAS